MHEKSENSRTNVKTSLDGGKPDCVRVCGLRLLFRLLLSLAAAPNPRRESPLSIEYNSLLSGAVGSILRRCCRIEPGEEARIDFFGDGGTDPCKIWPCRLCRTLSETWRVLPGPVGDARLLAFGVNGAMPYKCNNNTSSTNKSIIELSLHNHRTLTK